MTTESQALEEKLRQAVDFLDPLEVSESETSESGIVHVVMHYRYCVRELKNLYFTDGRARITADEFRDRIIAKIGPEDQVVSILSPWELVGTFDYLGGLGDIYHEFTSVGEDISDRPELKDQFDGKSNALFGTLKRHSLHQLLQIIGSRKVLFHGGKLDACVQELITQCLVALKWNKFLPPLNVEDHYELKTREYMPIADSDSMNPIQAWEIISKYCGNSEVVDRDKMQYGVCLDPDGACTGSRFGGSPLALPLQMRGAESQILTAEQTENPTLEQMPLWMVMLIHKLAQADTKEE